MTTKCCRGGLFMPRHKTSSALESCNKSFFYLHHTSRLINDIMMPYQSPSIQSFFSVSQRNSPIPTPSSDASAPIVAGDGFDQADVDAILDPSPSQPWIPTCNYEEVDITSLYSGPKCVTFMGRVVNYFDQPNASKSPRAAKGSLKVMVKDDTGAITVNIYAIMR